jgi:hypothetical protein
MKAVLSAVLVAAALAQAPVPAPVTPLWTVTEGMDGPESVYFDAASGFPFSSKIGGDAAARDGNGRIAKLTLDGKLGHRVRGGPQPRCCSLSGSQQSVGV